MKFPAGTGIEKQLRQPHHATRRARWMGGPADDYWLYPMRSDTVPTNNLPGAGANRGNFFDVDYAVTQSNSYGATQNYLTPVGAYTQAEIFYGTFDQGGNAFEWNDTMIFSSSRGLRGGSWYSAENLLRASHRYVVGPSFEFSFSGFRLATVPEPTVAVSSIVAGAWLLSRRKRPSAL